MIDQLLSRPEVSADAPAVREHDEPFSGEATSRVVSVMGLPNHAPDGAIMGGADRGPRIDLMGGPDRRPFDIMGGPDRSPRVDLMGESDTRFVDSLFTGRAGIPGGHRLAKRQQTRQARRSGVRGLAPGATVGA